MAIPTPQAFWNLDEVSGDAADATGNGYTLTNTNVVTYTPGLIGNSAVMTVAASQTLTRSDNVGVTSPTNISFSLWVYIVSTPSSGNGYILFTLRTTGGGSNYIDWALAYQNNAGTPRLMFQRTKPGVAGFSTNYNVTLSTATWYHIAMTYDTATLKGYLNASEVASAATSGVGSGGANSFFIGNGGSDDGAYSNARYDMFGIWNTLLSTTDITDLYNGGAGIQYPFVAPTSIKTINGLAKASVKTVNGLAIASVKTWNGLA